MKFIKLKTGAVRCILSSEDMKEYGLEIKDFMEQNEQATEFMHSLIERAAIEAGYVAKTGMITLKVMQMSDDRISITISEPGIDDMIQGDFADKMEALIKKFSELEQLKNLGFEEAEKGSQEVNPVQRIFAKKEVSVFSFRNLDSISEYAKSIQYGRPISSDLYKMDKNYVLLIRRGAMAEASYAKICFSAFDFEGKLLKEASAARFIEHGDCLINKKALSVMKTI